MAPRALFPPRRRMAAVDSNDSVLERFGRGRLAPIQKRSILLAHLACLGTQTFFGIGGVLAVQFSLKEGVRPVIFALIREGIAGPLLCLLAVRPNLPHRRPSPHSPAAPSTPSTAAPSSRTTSGALQSPDPACTPTSSYSFSAPKPAMACTRPSGRCACPAAARRAVWARPRTSRGRVEQPSQPVFTAMIAMAMCLERPAVPKLLGILSATAGAICVRPCHASPLLALADPSECPRRGRCWESAMGRAPTCRPPCSSSETASAWRFTSYAHTLPPPLRLPPHPLTVRDAVPAARRSR